MYGGVRRILLTPAILATSTHISMGSVPLDTLKAMTTATKSVVSMLMNTGGQAVVM